MPEASPRKPAIRMVHVVYAVLIYCAVVAAAWPRRTYDTWWHLATGRYIVQQGRIPHADPFTYTREGQPWITHEWLWEVIMYSLYTRWGFAGLIAMKALVCGICGVLLAWLCMKRGSVPLVALAVGAIGIFAARSLFNVRPQLASLLFLTLLLVLVQLARDGRERWLWLAPVVMLVWVNMHGGFIFGLAFVGLFAVCMIPTWLGQRRSGEPLTPSPTIVIGALALMAVATLVNPSGVAGALYPLEYVTGGHAYHKQIINEYASPNFSSAMFTFLGPYVLLLVLGLALSTTGIGLFDLAVTVVFLYLALRWERNVALFVFATAPIAAMQLSDFARKRLGMGEERPASQFVLGLVMVGLLVSAVFAVRSAPGRVEEVFAEDYPVECLQVVQEQDIRGNMFNTYRWGGYLAWHLWPAHKTFIDGRADVMGHELMMDWVRCHHLEPGWREVLDRHGVQWVLISIRSPLCRALRMTPEFELIHSTANAELFARRTPSPEGEPTVRPPLP